MFKKLISSIKKLTLALTIKTDKVGTDSGRIKKQKGTFIGITWKF